MKKVGILGGTFSPPHIGHMVMAAEAKFSLGLDEVRLMPNADPPHKKAPAANARQRARMAELAAGGCPGVAVERYETDKGGKSYTVETMEALTEREPDSRFYFLIGGDMMESLSAWHRIDDLLQLVEFAGFKRPGYGVTSKYPVTVIDAPVIELSSTFIRERIRNGGPFSHLVPPEVEQYIRKERLYGS
ncbi:nicotinate-nucleotide adenylyltransferase [Indiicoccus explosivorum]|uniref:nicotinate-nucleotide adenylyltransferase n=1 Tax=Indiicoccus explosivorum TaxID=1917864 RepID=UPI000B44E928|nr:nicotinate-nucleotide adenylyltransferase [Indiicoccus explosivorum]